MFNVYGKTSPWDNNTLHLKLRTLHLTLHTLHLPPYTPHSTLVTPHSTPLHYLHSTLYTPHFTRHTSRLTLDTSHFSLHTSHSTLHTSFFRLYTWHSALYTPHPTLAATGCNIYEFFSCFFSLCDSASVPLPYVRAFWFMGCFLFKARHRNILAWCKQSNHAYTTHFPPEKCWKAAQGSILYSQQRELWMELSREKSPFAEMIYQTNGSWHFFSKSYGVFVDQSLGSSNQ